MAIRTLLHKLVRLEARTKVPAVNPVLQRLQTEPSQIMAAAGMAPDPWQDKLLQSAASRMLMLASRQSGKSTVAAAGAACGAVAAAFPGPGVEPDALMVNGSHSIVLPAI